MDLISADFNAPWGKGFLPYFLYGLLGTTGRLIETAQWWATVLFSLARLIV